MARNNWDDEPLDADALMQQLGGEPPMAGGAGDKIDFGDVIPNTGNQGQIGHITRGGTVPLGPLQGPDDAATRLPTSNTMPVTPPQTILGGTTTTPPAFTRDTRDALKYGNVGRMEGFNTSDYGGDVKARNSVKNTFGRIASRYANAPNSVEAMMADPDFKSAFPNATRVAGGAGDKIDFGGVMSDFESGSPVGVVDVLTQSDPGTTPRTGGRGCPMAKAAPRRHRAVALRHRRRTWSASTMARLHAPPPPTPQRRHRPRTRTRWRRSWQKFKRCKTGADPRWSRTHSCSCWGQSNG